MATTNHTSMAATTIRTTDDSGELVERFALTMKNLGLARAADELVRMLESGRWRRFVQGFRTFEFQSGEFDYFLAQQGITREELMVIPNIEVKAKLESATDERRTGEEGHRRRVLEVRAEVPEIPGRPIVPFGYTEKEAKALVEGTPRVAGGVGKRSSRPALGDAVRRWTNTGGRTSRNPNDERPRWQRLVASTVRLPDDDLESLYKAVQAERAKRRGLRRQAS